VAQTETHLPHWDLSTVFPGLDSGEFDAAFRSYVASIERLTDLFEKNEIGGDGAAELDDTKLGAFDEIVGTLNSMLEELRLLRAYIFSFVSTDSRNALAQAKLSELEAANVAISKLETRFEAWIGKVGAESLIQRSELAKEHSFPVRRAEVSARRQMSQAEEDLYAELRPTGASAWGRLHGDMTSQLMVSVDLPDGRQSLPMSRVRALANDATAEVREAAYRAELLGWESVSVPLAASINSIKGDRNTIVSKRGWTDALEAELFNNNIDRTTLEAMQAAVTESFPDFRRYLKAKAKLLGKDELPWWDMFAPISSSDGDGDVREWDWDSATQFVVEQFGTYSEKMAGLARRAFDESWVDAEPRDGKRDGAFCMGVRADESRVMLNFSGSFTSVGTLAHELGHAYHNINLAHRTPMQRETPMALSETASIFCQNVIFRAALDGASESEKLSILEDDLQTTCQVVVDIHSRFLFESALFEGRRKRAQSVEELNEMMLSAQRDTYGDGLAADALHPYMWAMKPHYYGAHFYNWPYTFGLLFGLGLYAQYLEDPEKFRGGYDDLLSSTGMFMAADLAERFEIDINSEGFWRSSLDVIRERITDFERLAAT
jgi:oligoendopeptidase F